MVLYCLDYCLALWKITKYHRKSWNFISWSLYEPVTFSDTANVDEEIMPSKLTYDEPDCGMTSQSSRKSRFAQLAKNINNFEDDLSHPTIQ